MFFQIWLDHFVSMLVKNVSNMCSTKTYYVNHLTYKKCTSIDTSSTKGQLTD
jgi:hypothetical protein